jgi:hypothetical protein
MLICEFLSMRIFYISNIFSVCVMYILCLIKKLLFPVNFMFVLFEVLMVVSINTQSSRM